MDIDNIIQQLEADSATLRRDRQDLNSYLDALTCATDNDQKSSAALRLLAYMHDNRTWPAELPKYGRLNETARVFASLSHFEQAVVQAPLEECRSFQAAMYLMVKSLAWSDAFKRAEAGKDIRTITETLGFEEVARFFVPFVNDFTPPLQLPEMIEELDSQGVMALLIEASFRAGEQLAGIMDENVAGWFYSPDEHKAHTDKYFTALPEPQEFGTFLFDLLKYIESRIA